MGPPERSTCCCSPAASEGSASCSSGAAPPLLSVLRAVVARCFPCQKFALQARSSRVAHAPAAPTSSLLACLLHWLSVGLLGGQGLWWERPFPGWLWFGLVFFFFLHSEWLHQGKRHDAGQCRSDFVVGVLVQVAFGSAPPVLSVLSPRGLGSR